MRSPVAILGVLGLVCLVVAQARPPDKVNLRITTTLGDIEVELDAARAPVTTANFLKYVDGGLYTNGVFHRTVTTLPDNQPTNKVKIEVIQGGVKPSSADPAQAEKGFPPIALERTNKTGLKHVDGAISMARDGPDSATSDFFICIGPQPALDFAGKRNPDGQGFAAFGRVTQGMDVVRKIQASPSKAQKLIPPIKILKIERLP